MAAFATTAAVAFAAGDEPAPPQLLSVPAGGEPAAALERTDARTVARYRSFTLVEAEGGDARRLRSAGADVREDMRRVRIGDRSLDPARDRRALATKDASPRGPGLAVVQFVGPVKDAWLGRLRDTGVRVVSYMAQNGYLVHGSAPELGALAALAGRDPAVRAVVPFVAEDKLDSAVKPAGRQRLAVQTLSGADGSDARSGAAAAGRELRGTSAVGPFRTQFVEVDAAEARALAEDPGVISVAPAPTPELRDERQSQILAGNVTGADPVVPTAPGYLAFLDGLDLGPGTYPFAVDVTDEGIDDGTVATTHPDLHENGDLGQPSRLDYVDNFTVDPDARDCGGHGTINAGIAGGFNSGTGSAGAGAVEDAQGYNYGLGLAPQVRLGGSKIFRCTEEGEFSLTSSFTDLTTNAYEKGARISSNSWSTDVQGAYDADAQEYDALVRDAVPGEPGNQEMVEVFAAGNDGNAPRSVGSPGTAKNVITVGAAEGVRSIGAADGCGVPDNEADDAHDIWDDSGRGPSLDARTKPELVGPGTHVTGPRPQHPGYTGAFVCNAVFPAGSGFYSLSSGTSHATPAVAGMAALVREWFRQEKGGGTIAPSPAMTKAMLAGSATDLAGGNDGAGGAIAGAPNGDQGWGLPNLARALDEGPRYFIDQDGVLPDTGHQFVRTFSAEDPEKPVRVTLAWTDAVGPTVGASYVNDLDLRVAAGGGSFKGNVISGGRSVAGGNADPRNNVESVILPAGTASDLTVEVTAANIVADGVPGNSEITDQDFALTISNVEEVDEPVLSGQESEVTEVGGDGDGTVEPGEDFQLAETVKNEGPADATGVTGSLSAPPEVAITDATAAWPDLPAGTAAENSDPLAGSLPRDAECGRPVPLSLALTSTEGATATRPVAFESGAAGTPVTRTSSDVPKPIPDGSTTGVGSTLAVPAAGRIKDLNVTVAGLTHAFVGDLRLDLIAPDGTLVNLANRPGGRNNGDNNLTNTVFDDEAAVAIGSPGTDGPYTGSFKPQADQLSRLDGKQQQGTWTLRVIDLESDDPGSLTGWRLTISPAACTPPSTLGLAATAGAGAVGLDWDAVPGASGYEIFRRAAPSPYPPGATATSSTDAHTDTGLTGGTEYCYRVRAVNVAGAGPLSDEACTTPSQAPPDPVPDPGGGRIIQPPPANLGPFDDPGPLVDLSPIASSIRVDRRGRFTLRFTTIADTVGHLRVVTVRRVSRGRRLTLVSREFNSRASGHVRIRARLGRRGMRALRRARRLRVDVKVQLGETSRKRITLRAPRR